MSEDSNRRVTIKIQKPLLDEMRDSLNTQQGSPNKKYPLVDVAQTDDFQC